jgi:hypothetical protein
MLRIRPLMAAGLLLAVSLCAQPSHGSNDFKTVETSTPQEVTEAMSLKFVRGVSNAALGGVSYRSRFTRHFRMMGLRWGFPSDLSRGSA